MSNVLRSTTFQLEFNGNDGITGVRTFTKAVSDADAVVAELTKTLGENATVTVKNTQTKADLVRQAQQVASQFERSEKNTQRLVRQYENLAKTVNMTADEMEVFNAVSALGANANQQQVQQVTQAVQNFQRLRNEVDGTGGSFRDFRGVMQNAGWQLQDTVVQLQMGTSAFMVLSQQGSQFASAFGPTGAVIGAVIAVAGVIGGTLFTSLMNSKTELEKLDEATKEYEKYLSVTAEGVIELSDAFKQLARYSKTAGDEMLELSRMKALEAQKAALKAIKKEIKDIIPFGGNLADALGLKRNISGAVEFGAALRELSEDVDEYSLDRFSEALALINPESEYAEKGAQALKIKLYELFSEMAQGEEILNKTRNGVEGIADESEKTVPKIDEIVRAFEREYDSLIKQTESVDQEYTRRKALIDSYVAHIKGSNEKSKEAYEALEKWRVTQEDKEFQTFYKNIVKKTNTVSEEYDRQKAIIDSRVKRMGETDQQSAQAYAALEAWKTSEFTKQYDKRERVRREIERGQIKQKRGDDPKGAEADLFASNVSTLAGQWNSLAEDQLAERQRINALMEAEMIRHRDVMTELEMQGVQNQLGLYSMAAQQLTSIADLMATGANDVKNKTAEMNDFQKGMFLISQVIAAATAFINGMLLGSKLATLTLNPAWIGIGTALGAAQAGAIMGVTIAGAFDKGGNIPTGQVGIVSEYGDELVNGVLVKGPARVTSREETARMMNQNGGGVSAVSLKVSVENQIPNGNYEVQQLGPNEIKIIATQVFNQNIDNGVSRTLSNRNSKASKAMRSNFNTTSKV